MKLTIVTAYHNRKELFLNTYHRLNNHPLRDLFEIVVVNDGSDEEHSLEHLNLDIVLITIDKKDKKWINPCVPFNIGLTYFDKINSDIVIIQNPECIHVGDIISEALKIKPNEYIVFGCYSVGKNTDINNFEFVNSGVTRDGTDGWYQHSKYRNHMLHFCSALRKEDLVFFDQEYKDGIGYDDNDFLLQIQRKGMNIKCIDDPYVIHQYHGTTNYSNRELVKKNYDLYVRKRNN